VHESVKLKPEKVSSFELISFCSLRWVLIAFNSVYQEYDKNL